jgi:hypothetical protein
MKVPQLALAVPVAALTALLVLAVGTARATTINCQHTGPIVGQPGMEYVCYVHHDDGHKEIFYAPGPVHP